MNIKDIYFAKDGDTYYAALKNPYLIAVCSFSTPGKDKNPCFKNFYRGVGVNVYPYDTYWGLETEGKLEYVKLLVEQLRYYTDKESPELERIECFQPCDDIADWILGENPATGGKCMFYIPSCKYLDIEEGSDGSVSFSGQKLTLGLIKAAEEFYWQCT